MSIGSDERASADDFNRRRAPRVEVSSGVVGQLTTRDAPIALLNLSAGGFLMQTPIELAVGAVEGFRLTTSLGAAIAVRARVVRALRVGAGDGASYVIGLEFVDRQNRAINDLVALLQQ